MRTILSRRIGLILLFACVSIGVISAQPAEHQPKSSTSQEVSEKSGTSAEPAASDPNSAAGVILETATEKAVHRSEAWGRKLGLGRDTSYWISLALNFGGIAVLSYILLKSKLPQMFRDRTIAIQKALKEAQAASAEASRRLGDIEARLARMDVEVSEIKAAAERESATEEERMRNAAEEDKRKVVDAAESEIAATARSARSELKSFAASLAVEIASHRIKVDDDTDHALVRQFVSHLGKDGE